MSSTKQVATVHKAITEARKAGFSYADPELVKLLARMEQLTGPR